MTDIQAVIKRELWARLDEVMRPAGSMHETEPQHSLAAEVLQLWDRHDAMLRERDEARAALATAERDAAASRIALRSELLDELDMATDQRAAEAYRADQAEAERDAMRPVIEAAKAWVDRCEREPGHPDHPNVWGDEVDFALIAAVDLLAAASPSSATQDDEQAQAAGQGTAGAQTGAERPLATGGIVKPEQVYIVGEEGTGLDGWHGAVMEPGQAILANESAATVTVSRYVAQMLTAGALNDLYQADQDEGCCTACCGPCQAIERLLDSGQLDDVVRDYAPGSDWWSEEAGGQVDRKWLARSWRMEACHRG